MSEEYISRKSVRDAIASLSIERFELTPAYRLYVEALDNVDKKVVKIPAADVAPVRHGHWTGTEYDGYADGNPVYTMFECSECGVEYGQEEHYCPWCGAKMDGDTDG